jgi:hypothetical protein
VSLIPHLSNGAMKGAGLCRDHVLLFYRQSDSRACPAISRISQSNESRFCVILRREDMSRQAHNLKVVSSNLAPATK